MELLTLGISHKTAPVALRERLALSEREAERFVQEAVNTPEIREAVALSTCNRTEIYLVVGDPVEAESDVLGMLAQRAGIRPTELAEVIYSPRNCDAARQLYRVTSGLESMVVGEAEIQGQVKRAYDNALAAQTTGPLTNKLFAAALLTGKRVRSETELGAGRVSVPSVAVGLARAVVGDLNERRVVIIGTGETSELTARALADQGVSTIFVANRHADRARSLAERFGGTVASLDQLPAHLERADIVVASTSSPHPIVGHEELELVMRARNGRSLLLIDLAVPRDVDPDCADLPDVTLYDMDDLQAAVARSLSVRESEAARAEAIVEEEIQRFARWLDTRDVTPAIAALRERGSEIVDRVLTENAGRWESASPRDLARVEAVARTVVQRLLHEPTIRLKSLGGSGVHGRLALLRELFGLEELAGGDDHRAAPAAPADAPAAPAQADPPAAAPDPPAAPADAPSVASPADVPGGNVRPLHRRAQS
ncbi:MAG TPA: glutamyl-tRNA reductase [Solirubrobacteraceae bacterium]|jgi:glutamyl-tRNA reductase|nr:glutamyl-tRNA reductase [Solirubrobacteraceae bacterium]